MPGGSGPSVVRTTRRHGEPAGRLPEQDPRPCRSETAGYAYGVQRDPKDHTRGRAAEGIGSATREFHLVDRARAGGDVRNDAATNGASVRAIRRDAHGGRAGSGPETPGETPPQGGQDQDVKVSAQ